VITLIATQCACSAAVAALAVLGVRPLVMAAALPVIVGSCWIFA
jgi:hypothetical protein